MKVGDLVKLKHENNVGIVIEIKPHPYHRIQTENFCRIQWPNHVNEVMSSWLEVINEDR